MLAGFAVVIAVLGLSTAAASADSVPQNVGLTTSTGSGSCSSQFALCLYRNDDYQSPEVWSGVPEYGLGLASGYSVSDLGDNATDLAGIPGFDDSIESVINNSSSRYCLYSGTNYTGETYEIHGYNYIPDLGYMDNMTQSIAPGPCPTVTGAVYGYEGQCMDLEGGIVKPYQAVNLQGCEGDAEQQWIVSTASYPDDWYNIQVGENGGYCLGAHLGASSDGTPVDIYQCNHSPSQYWQYNSATGQVIDDQEDSAGQTMCLDDTGYSTIGAQLQIWSCTGGPNQQFSFPS
jgi:hypothetical protein